MLCVPVRAPTGTVAGVLELLNASDTAGGFSDADSVLMRSMAIHVSTVLSKLALENELNLTRQKEHVLHQLVDISSAESFGIKKAIQKILRAASLVVRGRVYLRVCIRMIVYGGMCTCVCACSLFHFYLFPSHLAV
jgi:hypothetical protein